MPKRVVGCFVTMFFLFACTIGRVYEVSGQWLAQTARQQASRTVTVYRSRGTLYDRALVPLTNADSEWRICALATAQAAELLPSCLTGEQMEQVQQRWQQGTAALLSLPGPLPSATGVLQFRVPVRYSYPLPAQHLIGYTDAAGAGVTGLEQALEQRLTEAGGAVEVTYTVDGTGQVLVGEAPEVRNTLALSRAGVALTIDGALQQAAEEICARLLPKGAVVVTDPATGQILAAVSCPQYRGDRVADWLEDPDAALVNRVMSNYNVGSVFKIVSAATALETGVSPEQRFVCTGSVPVGARNVRCHYRLGHGEETMREGFVNSCNPYFVQLMQTVGAAPFRYMASALGFDKALLPAPGYKTARAVLPSDAEWQMPSMLADLSFGQGTLLATPLHIAQLVGAVVNDGQAVRPTVVLGDVDASGVLRPEPSAAPQPVFSAGTAALLREMMIATVERGTGKAGAPSSGGAGGKTGTAETGWQTADGGMMVQSWFAGFYPAQQPRYVVVVLSEDSGTTGCPSAPVFRELCDLLARTEAARGA